MVTLNIEKIITGGIGLAHLPDGMAALVPSVLPGEEVRAEISRRRNGYVEAALLEIRKPSPHRLEPPCPYYSSCGGCKLMHADYEYQCRIKENCLRDMLARGLKDEPKSAFSFAEFIPAPRPLNYRQRIRLQVDGRGRLGFFQAKTHRQVNIPSCLLAEPALNTVLEYLAGSAAMRKWAGVAAVVELLFSPLDDLVTIIMHLNRRVRPADRQTAAALASANRRIQAVWLAAAGAVMEGPYWGQNALPSDSSIRFALPYGERQRLEVGFEPGGFCQVNLAQNEELVRIMLDWAGAADTRVLDLYCGLGNLSLPLSRYASEVVGIDVQRSTIRSAVKNAQKNHVENCRFIRAKVGDALRELSRAGEQFDLIILDPPRQGGKYIIDYLPKFNAARIIYISCDPATLVRDLNCLAGSGYKLGKIRGLDMFPQTSHMETIALLTAK